MEHSMKGGNLGQVVFMVDQNQSSIVPVLKVKKRNLLSLS